MDSMNESNTTTGLLEALQERQREIWSRLPRFLGYTSLLALVGMVITSIIQAVTGTVPVWEGGSVFVSNPTLGSVIATFLSLISVLVMWIFVIWSISFIPFVGYQAIKASQKLGISRGTKPFKWVQLGISVLIPLVTFALIWNGAANLEVNTSFYIESVIDAILLVLGIAAVIILLVGINKLVPPHLVTVRVSLLSFMLYITLFLTYGWGVGLASNSMLFGVLIYLMFGMNDVGQLARRITIYDIDTEVVEGLDGLLTKIQELDVQRNATEVQQISLNRKKEKVEQLGRSAQIEMDEFLLDMLQTRFRQLRQTFELLSTEASDRFDDKIQEKIGKLRREAKGLSPTELSGEISSLMAEIDEASQDIPEALQLLRGRVIEAGRQYQKALQNFDQKRSSLMIGQERFGHENSLLSAEVNVIFDRLRNVVSNHSGISLQTRDKILKYSGSVQTAFLEALNDGKYTQVEQYTTEIRDILDTLVKTQQIMQKRPDDQQFAEQPEAFASRLDDLLNKYSKRLREDVFEL
jgi:hypothetical protein